MSATELRVRPPVATPRRAAAPRDPRWAEPVWPIPSEAAARRRARLLAVVCVLLGAWYLVWLLQARRIGAPGLFAVLVVAETFNLLQAIGFWWTCAHQRMRTAPPRAGTADAAVDVMIPVYDEPLEVVEPTVAAAIALDGEDVRIWLLDDGRSNTMKELADRFEVGYLTRADNAGAKAGNINHALGLTDAPFVLVLDCDHVPRPDMLEHTLGYLEEDERVAFVQTPQYYANHHVSPIAAAAAAQQALFFGPIARGKDGLGAMFCAGTNMVLRRTALLEVGGFPPESLTEDFELSIRLHERRWRSVYHPEVLALGLGPEDMASYVSQQQRWARGCLSSLPLLLRARLPLRHRVQYLLSSTYFLSGWTLLVYMSLPVVRILFGIQPLAATSADQFLLHFAPYYCSALATVAVAGYGTYTYGAFALAAGSFWIHVQATISGLLRRRARFVVTRKTGANRRQPRAAAPALLAAATLVAVGAYGLAHGRSAATLNNVAFAALHATVLLTGVGSALRVRRSAPLAPEAPLAPPARTRHWPRWATLAAIAACFAVPAAVAVVGHRALGPPVTATGQAHDAAESFMARYVDADGRVVRRDQGGDTVSEGQGYAMLLAVALDDRARFDSVWSWTKGHLQRPDGLLAFRWQNGRVTGSQSASDADLDAARALVLASERFGVPAYLTQGRALARAVLDRETALVAGRPVLVAGPWATTDPRVVNVSYFSPRAYADLSRADPDPRWTRLAATSREIVGQLVDRRALATDWTRVGAAALQASPAPGPAPATAPASSGLDAVRLPIRAAESCVHADWRAAAAEWPLYRPAPGRARYAPSGRPLTGQVHAASLVGAAAAARAAGDPRAENRLLGAATAADRAHPTYYGAAWVALGRIMLTTQALGGC